MKPDEPQATNRQENSQTEQPKIEHDGTEVVDSDDQAELRKAYILQQRRMRCPGCGEGEENF